jgi:ABC-type glutathione transport system ATPase component
MGDLLRLESLRVEYGSQPGILGGSDSALVAVRDVSFGLPEGKTLALVGESGSGKTSVARAILGLAPIAAGRVLLNGDEIASPGRQPTRAERRKIQMVFQQPTASLDPRMRVGDSIAEPLVHLIGLHGRELQSRVEELLVMVGLDPTAYKSYPRHLSGGQRQRVAIARAIGPNPQLVICDEPTTSLDVSVQAQIINLLAQLQAKTRLSLLFISHDLGLVRQIADQIAVMFRGQIVQIGTADDVLDHPTHPYAQALIRAVPRIEGARNDGDSGIEPRSSRIPATGLRGA